ncbi:hypothetical protein [Thermomonas sp.]|uniref:hypothetical protein n=1 Tax=Thermomonas sp. TaxID=1971895 RepID=UPI0035AFC010
MTTATDVIAALNQRRQRKSLRPEAPGQFPSGWQDWFDAMPRVDAHAPGAAVASLVDAAAAKPLRAIPRSPRRLNRWQAFGVLWQQNWEPDLREDRNLRIGVRVLDMVLHLLLAGALLWLMYLGYLALAHKLDEEDEAVQVEFIGRGNVAEGGGALANAGADSAPTAAAPAQRAATPSPASGRPDAAIAQVPMPAQPPMPVEAETPTQVRAVVPPLPAEAAQPLQVSESPRPPEPTAFQLPPVRERSVQVPEVQLREVQPREQVDEVATLRPQPVRTLQPSERQAQLRVPELRNQPQSLDVPTPQRMQAVAARATPDIATRQVQVPALRGEVRDIPMPPGGAPTPATQPGRGTSASSTAAANGAGGERGNAASAGKAAAGNGQGSKAATKGGRGVTTAGTGAGPGNKPAPGGWPGTAKTDDWGASSRNVAGTGTGNGRNGDGNGKSGLYNDDGSLRLPDEWTQISGLDLDRSGTWLKRPGLEYKATRFDQYWIPQGNLLEEWVRRGIKKVSIPIPGSSRRLQCVVSLLALGGACMPVSDDVNEQPAMARPPPDIPFKPQLQEDNGSVKPQDPPAG